jgi:hypothetical protein
MGFIRKYLLSLVQTEPEATIIQLYKKSRCQMYEWWAQYVATSVSDKTLREALYEGLYDEDITAFQYEIERYYLDEDEEDDDDDDDDEEDKAQRGMRG